MNRLGIAAVGIGVALAGAGVGGYIAGFPKVHGKVRYRGPVEIKETRVALLQGPTVEALFAMGVIQPGSEVTLQGGNTQEWTTADAEGKFAFDGVRFAEATVVGFSEFADGRICQTSNVKLDVGLWSYDADLEIRTSPCWKRSKVDGI